MTTIICVFLFFRVHVFKGTQYDDSAVQNAKQHANTLKVSDLIGVTCLNFLD